MVSCSRCNQRLIPHGQEHPFLCRPDLRRGEAAAIEARAKALGTNPNLVTLVQAERWNGVLPTTMVPGSAVPFVSLK
jgi:hypothetical protein